MNNLRAVEFSTRSSIDFSGAPFDQVSSIKSIIFPINESVPDLKFSELFKGSAVESQDWSDFNKIDSSTGPETTPDEENSSTALIVVSVFLGIFVVITIVLLILFLKNGHSSSGTTYQAAVEV